MKPRNVIVNRPGCGRWAVLVAVPLMFLSLSIAQAEMYIGGQVGLPFFGNNNKLTSVDLTDVGFPAGSTLSPPGSMSGLDLKSSPMFGAKMGYYFQAVPWFGLEVEAYYTTPHIEQQPSRVTIAPGTVVNGPNPGSFPSGVNDTSIVPGQHFRVITVAPLNLMFRYQKARLQPYIGVGPGIFLAHIDTAQSGIEGSQSSTRVGLNAKLGAEYFFTRNISGYGEVRYNYTTLDFEGTDSGVFGIRAIYNPITFSVGIGYHF